MDRMIDVVYRPHHYIEIIIAIFVLIGGLYIGSPWYIGSNTTADVNPGLYASLVTESARYVFAFLFSLPSILVLWGKFRKSKRLTQWGLYFSYIVILFTVVLIWATSGLRPLNWLSPFIIGLITATLWIRSKWEDKLR
jgi:uncharacterized membrane protein